MYKPLTESVLYRLTGEGFAALLGRAEKLACAFHPGVGVILCGEPVADLNCVVAGRGASDGHHFRDACRMCVDQGQPFLAILFPEAGSDVEQTVKSLGLVHAVDFPMMVREDLPIEPAGNDELRVELAAGEPGAAAWAAVLSTAFKMPPECVRRAMPASLTQSPAVDVYLALDGDRPVGTVTLTHHGETTGVWAMGTDTSLQRRGFGRRLLSTAMSQARARGTRRFFLGATPAGYKLYESLGYETRVVTKVWALGETSQS